MHARVYFCLNNLRYLEERLQGVKTGLFNLHSYILIFYSGIRYEDFLNMEHNVNFKDTLLKIDMQ